MFQLKSNVQRYPAVMTIMGMTIFFFIITLLQGRTNQVFVNLGALYAPYVIVFHQYWRFITAGFLHFDAMHLLSNMISLYVAGQILEPIFKKERFLVIYFVSLVMGNAVSFAFGAINSIRLGASGAVYGLFMTVVLLQKLAPHHSGVRMMSQKFIMVLIINVLLSVAPGIDFLAHIGGLLGGIIGFYMCGYFQHDKGKQRMLSIVFVGIVVVLIIIGSRGV